MAHHLKRIQAYLVLSLDSVTRVSSRNLADSRTRPNVHQVHQITEPGIHIVLYSSRLVIPIKMIDPHIAREGLVSCKTFGGRLESPKYCGTGLMT